MIVVRDSRPKKAPQGAGLSQDGFRGELAGYHKAPVPGYSARVIDTLDTDMLRFGQLHGVASGGLIVVQLRD